MTKITISTSENSSYGRVSGLVLMSQNLAVLNHSAIAVRLTPPTFDSSDDDIEAAVVCTENLTHEDFAAQLLAAGKHVIVEYPAALSEKGTRRLFQLAEVISYKQMDVVDKLRQSVERG